MLECAYTAATYLSKTIKKWIVLATILSVSIFNLPISSIADSVDQKKSDFVSEEEKSKEEEIQSQVSDASPGKEKTETESQEKSTTDVTKALSEDTESIDGLTMLYIGGAVAGAAVLAAALGSSSSTSDPIVPPPELPTIPIVGPDLRGTGWTGTLNIKDQRYKGFQAISAKIAQRGSSVQIDTSSTLYYGRQFNGTISSSGYMLMYDSISGEDWTTFKNNATSTKVDLYDYVNDFNDLDRMYLSR
jgi:hypothetical protein